MQKDYDNANDVMGSWNGFSSRGFSYRSNELANEPLFRAQEWSLDLFGSVSVGQETINRFSQQRVRDDGRLGLGAGGNYFFTRNFGLGRCLHGKHGSSVRGQRLGILSIVSL